MQYARKHKYNARRVVHEDGTAFDSAKEMRRYQMLLDELKEGAIRDLKVHVPIKLYAADGTTEQGAPIGKYYADFTYYRDDEWIVEDVKGSRNTRTAVYLLKKKILAANRGIDITEIY